LFWIFVHPIFPDTVVNGVTADPAALFMTVSGNMGRCTKTENKEAPAERELQRKMD
jgi:hypothetical protein